MGLSSLERSMTTINDVMKCHHQTYVSGAKFTNCDRVTSSWLRVTFTPFVYENNAMGVHLQTTNPNTSVPRTQPEVSICKQVKAHARSEFLTNRVLCVHLLYRSQPF